MNQFYVNFLFFFMFNACANGLPMFKNKNVESKPSHFSATPAMVDLHKNFELDKAREATNHEQHHREEKSKKFVLNPMQIHHNDEIAKANKSFKIHLENGKQLSIAEKSGAFKITKSKSGNHDHYSATLPGME